MAISLYLINSVFHVFLTKLGVQIWSNLSPIRLYRLFDQFSIPRLSVALTKVEGKSRLSKYFPKMKETRKKRTSSLESCILPMIQFAMFLFCLACFCWQFRKCFTKFMDSPRGTFLSVEQAELEMFPDVTFCDDFSSTAYNKNILKECEIT